MNNLVNSLKDLKQTLIPYLLGFALMCMSLGVALFYIELHANILAGILVLVALLVLVVLFCNLIFNLQKTTRSTGLLSSKVIKQIVVVLVVVSVSLSVIGVSHYLASKSAIRWDVTQDKQHTLSPHSIEFIDSLTSEVKLSALYVGVAPKYLEDLFNEYRRLSSDLITTEIIDPINQITYAAKFGNAINAQERKVIVQSGLNSTEVDFTDSSLSEEKLTNAIANVIRSPRKVYFLTGHGEYSTSNEEYAGLSSFKKLLSDNNIQSEPLMLGIRQSIPIDCDVLIIAGPKNHLTANEEALISNYLNKGGDALFLIEHTVVTTPDKPLTSEQLLKNPSLNNILNQWGLDVQSDIVVDISNHIGDDVGSPATKNYQQHKALTDGLDYTFYVRPRSIRVLEQRRENIKLAVIASTASIENSWAESNRSLAIEFNPETDTAGPVPFSYVVFEQRKRERLESNPKSDTRLIVFTDADFLTNVYINQYSNAQMGLNVVNWLAESDYKTFVTKQDIKVERLDLTSKHKRQVISILVLLPFSIAIFGLVVWLRTSRR